MKKTGKFSVCGTTVRSRTRREGIRRAAGISSALLLALSAMTLLATPSGNQSAAKRDRSPKKYGIASGADQVLSAVYDPSSNSLRVNGGGTSSTSVGLAMPSTFSVSGSPVTSSGTISVNWAQPVSIANGGTGQTSASAAFNAVAPPTGAGGLIYGTGAGSYGNLTLGASGQCLSSNGLTLVWTPCSPGTVIALGGDLGGTLTDQIVVGLQGHPVSGSAPGAGQVLEWNAAANAWSPATLPNLGTVLETNGASDFSQGALNLVNGANITFSNSSGATVTASVTGTLPPADVPAINLAAPGNGGITGTLAVANGGTGLASPGASGQCLTSTGSAMAWGSCGAGSSAIQVNGANTSSQTPVNFQSGGYITVTNPSAGNIQFNFSGPLAVANGGTGLTAPGSAGQCLGSNGVAAVWTACGSGSAVALETSGTNNASQAVLNLVAGTNVALSNTGGGNVTISAASGSLPASWTVAGGTNALSAQPARGQDATVLTLAPSLATGGTADIFDVCSATPCSSGSKYFWITYNGGLGFSGNNVQLGSSSQPTQSYLRLYGGSTPNAPAYLDLLSNTGAVRTDLFASTSAPGIACVGSSIPGGDCGPAVASTSYLISAAGGTAPTAGDCVRWTSSTQIGDSGAACGSGGGSNSVAANPSSTQTITPGSASVTPLILKGTASQTADLFDVQNSSGGNVLQVQSNGAIDTGYFASNSSIHAAGNFVLDSLGGHFDSSASNSDAAGEIAVSSSTSSSHTFSSAFSAPPVCVLTPISNPGGLTWWVTTTTASVTVNISAAATITFNYICMGNPN
ncbi:MAG: hypothetical protein ACRD3D_10360 [Terriglobia bacterium]